MELGLPELIIVFAVFLLLFGANKLPGLGEGLGKAIRSFKEGMRGEDAPAPKSAEKPPEALPPASSLAPPPAEKPAEPARTDGKGA
jgi:sec-independent protein translocase protein TatA